MKNCPKCGFAAPDDAAYCPSCGASLNSQPEGRCPRCGRPVAPGQICLYCASHQNDTPSSGGLLGSSPLTMWQYMGLILLSGVPLVGLIFMIIWACNSNQNIHLRNFARGALLVKAVGIVLGILLTILCAGLIASMASAFEHYGSTYGYHDFSQFTGAVAAFLTRL